MDINKKFSRLYVTGGYYILIILILGIISILFNVMLGALQIVIALILFFINYLVKEYNNKQVAATFEQLSLNVNNATRNSLLNFPLPTLVVQSDGKIKWYNEQFRDIFKTGHLFDKNIEELIPELNLEAYHKEDNILTEISYKGRYFNVAGSIASMQNSEKKNIIVLYFDEITDYMLIKQKYINEKTFECLVFVDNYDELMQSTKSISQPQLQAKIYTHVNDWTNEFGGVPIRYEKDKYQIIFEYKCLDQFIKNKFEILTRIRNIDEGNTLPATISIGIGVGGEDIAENDVFAKTAINMALGRGGDQVVIKDSEQFRFYGGTTKEYEKSTRVKARVVSFALTGLIANAENVVIMSHKNADIDSVGSAFGIYRICKMQNKPVNILLETYDQSVKNMLMRLENVEEYSGLFMSNQQAAARVNPSTLLVIVDTHKPTYVENPAILTQTDQIVVIDHHRRGADFIEHTSLIYHEPYASSTCEMITEILQYTSDKLSLTKLEAECLYAGIVIDTKNFTFKTGVRTFEAASFLRKQGVDTVAIKTIFQQDMGTYIKRANIIRNAEIIRDHIAISICQEKDSDVHLLVAQAADELLNIKGITASFVLCKQDSGINISGRSLGGINVQMILEKMGGGGHLTIAGAQIDNVNEQEAKDKLIEYIEEYYLETTN